MSGSKPLALHTEYAKESAEWDKPYGAGTDIVFYLERADLDSGESGELPTSEDSMMKAMENRPVLVRSRRIWLPNQPRLIMNWVT